VAINIIWSEKSIDDLESIATYIEKDSIYYAKSVVTTIFSKVDILLEFPLLGRVVPEYQDKNIRELFVYSYRLIYKINKNNISIVTIIHGKRILTSSL